MRTRKTLAGLLMVAAAVLSTTLWGQAARASIPLDEHWVNLMPKHDPVLLLDNAGGSTSDGADVIQWTWVPHAKNQQWMFIAVGNSYYIVNRTSHMCVTTDGIPGHTLFQRACGSPNQTWHTDMVGSNYEYYTIRNVSTNLYMDVYGSSTAPGAKVCAWYYNGNDNQKFRADVQ